MVLDGIFYALGLMSGGGVVGYLIGFWPALPFYVLAVFCLYFFRDPERRIPEGSIAVSPADGRVVSIRGESASTRVSIFLNIFDVHVNRAPVAGAIETVQYRKGRFRVASREIASSENEQNTVTVRQDDGTQVVFAQVAGLIARRIVFRKKMGDAVKMGERVGLIKFGSRVDVYFGPEWEIAVQSGQRVSAGSSILARKRQPDAVA
jgi:phosphatidylserine decarboxylase